MAKATKKLTTAVATLTTTVDAGWVEFVTGGPEGFADIFLSNGHCGYWLMGIAHGRKHGDPKKGWLAYDHAAKDRHATKLEIADALEAWKAGDVLPPDFYALNLELAIDSWLSGVSYGGEGWFENGDGGDYDCAIQRTLFGKMVYG